MDPSKSYEAHQDEWARKAAELTGSSDELAFLLDTSNADYWIQHQSLRIADPFVTTDANARWLTVGDGRYGRDALYLKQKGAWVEATDISDSLLKLACEAHLIDRFARQNAEDLTYEDRSFDYVFCKEALHHFPRPYVALYEMLRVASRAVILIEPNDTRASRFLTVQMINRLKDAAKRALGRMKHSSLGVTNEWEAVGNYVYTLSERDIEKVALSLGLPAIAFRDISFVFPEDAAFKASDEAAKIRLLRRKHRWKDWLVRARIQEPGLRASVIFKSAPSAETLGALAEQGFSFHALTYPTQAVLRS